MPASKSVQTPQTEVVEFPEQAELDHLREQVDWLREQGRKVISMAPTYQGGICVLRADGRMFERITDPAPRTTPGLPGKIWVEIEPPKV